MSVEGYAVQRICLLDLSDALIKVKEFQPHKLIFWLGAGIDFGSPTSLPSNDMIVDLIMDLACGKSFDELMGEWEMYFKATSNKTIKEIVSIRKLKIETIKEVLRFFEGRRIRRVSAIDGMKSFSSEYLKPNHEHYVLAYYLHHGANIVTTNYSDFIITSYKELYGKGTIKHKKDYLQIYEASNFWSSRVYHLHGIGSDLNQEWSNYYTLESLKDLPDYFRRVYVEWLKNGYCIVYAGYAGNDDDVKSFLDSINDCNNATGVYLRHASNLNTDVQPFYEWEKTLLRPFGIKIITPCDISDFFRTLKEFPEKDPYHETICLTNWKKAFNKCATTNIDNEPNSFWIPSFYSRVSRYLKKQASVK